MLHKITPLLFRGTREMRKIVGLPQKDYAEKDFGIYPRVLLDIENDRGNPTLEILQKVAEPFGLKVGFVKSNVFAKADVTQKC